MTKKVHNHDFLRFFSTLFSDKKKIEEPENNEIKRKLHEVLSEGMLDSVLPYLLPANTVTQRRMSTGKIQGLFRHF